MAGRRVVIIGSGLSGGLLACQLARRGCRVTVYERRPDPRKAGFTGGRSINLALSCRGLTALGRVGLAEQVMQDAVRMPGRMMHSESGELTYQPYSKDSGDAINSVSRGGLNVTLLDAAEAAGAEIVFDHRFVDADLDAPAAVLEDPSGTRIRAECDALFGADGAYSAVRACMQTTDRFDYSQNYLGHGYKELVIPPVDGEYAIEPNALHIWPRGGSMMIALPNTDKSFTCTLFWPYEGEISFAALPARELVLPFFQEHFADAAPLMPTLVDDYMSNPVGSLVTIRCSPWHVGGRVLLIGDAAHAIVPFYGQGINLGFEDCRVLDELLDTHHDDLDAVFPVFSATRKRHADAIADMAIENFTVMRDRVADPAFLARKRVEHVLHGIDADRYTPLYNLVSFTNTPYADARETGERVVALAESIVEQIGVGDTQACGADELESRVRSLLASSVNKAGA